MYETCRLVRIFDPTFASQHLDSAYVDSMAAITPLRSLDMLDASTLEEKSLCTSEATALWCLG